MKRRVVAGLTALALLFTMQLPKLAVAAPLLDVITLDPTVVGSNSRTGTAPFNANSYNPGTGQNQGQDGSPTDHIVRTNDLIQYDFQYSVNSANGQDVQLTSTLGTPGVADWTGIPAGCNPATSSITNGGQTLTCDLGAVTNGTAADIVGTAKVRTSAPNGTQITPSVTITDTPSGAAPVTNSGYWLTQVQQAPTTADTITSLATFNLLKQTTAIQPVIEPYTYSGEIVPPSAVPVQGYYIDYPILVREGDGTLSDGSQFGFGTAASPITFTDTINSGPGTVLASTNPCGINGSGIKIAAEPYGQIGIGGSTSANSVVNSGTISCSQTSATTYQITITGADTSGSSFPVNSAGGAGVDNQTYVIAGYLRLFVPDVNGNISATTGGTATSSDSYSPINPNQPNANEPLANRTANEVLTAKGPAGAAGNSGKAFYSNTSEAGFASSNNNGPALTPGEAIVGVFALTNTSTAATGNVTLNNVVACDDVATAQASVTAYSGLPGFPADTNFGGAVHFSAINGGSFTDAQALAAGFTVGYADATAAANCSTGTFYPTLAAFAAAEPAGTIARVKVTAPSLTPGQQLRVQLSLTVASGLTAGTIVPNTMQGTATASTGGAPLTTSAGTTGQIFTTNLAVVKYLYKDTAGHALFAASQAQAPGAAGKSGGQVDTNQQFVSFLDVDGSQGTLPSTNVVTCDLIPSNATVHAFDGTTGPAVATYGGPVSFATISGTTPASYVVQYSTAPQVANDTCLNAADGWSTTPPSPLSATTKIRAFNYTLPANTRIRMYVNLQANAGLTAGTQINNTMVTTVGGSGATQSAQSVTVEPETVSVTKAGPASPVTAGGTATFTIQGYVQGVGTAQSGLITVVDTLPLGLTYVPNSTVLTPPPPPTTWIAGSANATPVITTNGGGQQVLTWTLGQTTPAPGVYIQLPTIAYTVNTDISLVSGNYANSVTIADPNDPNPGGPGHTATASVNVTNTTGFHISKVALTTQVPVGGTITWYLQGANVSPTPITSTDYIDVLPYNGDSRGSSFHGTLTLVDVHTLSCTPIGSGTLEYTNAPGAQVNEDPGCSSNGGSVTPPTGGCLSVPVTTWCPALSGGACPSSIGQVTAIRLAAGALPANSGTKTIVVDAVTSGNLFTDQYWNSFGARSSISTLGVHTPPVQTIVPIPANPFVTLVKSCLSPATCTSAAQAPGTDITYGITATNTGGHVAGSLTITDPLPVSGGVKYVDFKLGTATANFPSGTTVAVSYSSDGVNFTYTPVSGGGGAATGYDRNVVAVRFTMTGGTLGTTSPSNTGTVQFTAAIQ